MSDSPLAVFWECANPACRFRYVESAPAGRGTTCPRCGAAAQVVARVPRPDSMDSADTSSPVPLPSASPFPTPFPTIALLLDNFRSAYNVGAAFRTADAAGVTHVYLSGITPAPTHPRVQKTALGAEQWVPWSHHPNGVALSARLKQEGWTLWGMETAASARRLNAQQPLPSKLVLALGNEVAGLDPGILTQADAVVALPMWGRKRSLNVASALAAALYVLRCCAL